MCSVQCIVYTYSVPGYYIVLKVQCAVQCSALSTHNQAVECVLWLVVLGASPHEPFLYGTAQYCTALFSTIWDPPVKNTSYLWLKLIKYADYWHFYFFFGLFLCSRHTAKCSKIVPPGAGIWRNPAAGIRRGSAGICKGGAGTCRVGARIRRSAYTCTGSAYSCTTSAYSCAASACFCS